MGDQARGIARGAVVVDIGIVFKRYCEVYYKPSEKHRICYLGNYFQSIKFPRWTIALVKPILSQLQLGKIANMIYIGIRGTKVSSHKDVDRTKL